MSLDAVPVAQDIQQTQKILRSVIRVRPRQRPITPVVKKECEIRVDPSAEIRPMGGRFRGCEDEFVRKKETRIDVHLAVAIGPREPSFHPDRGPFQFSQRILFLSFFEGQIPSK
jgi:hypothetical protein